MSKISCRQLNSRIVRRPQQFKTRNCSTTYCRRIRKNLNKHFLKWIFQVKPWQTCKLRSSTQRRGGWKRLERGEWYFLSVRGGLPCLLSPWYKYIIHRDAHNWYAGTHKLQTSPRCVHVRHEVTHDVCSGAQRHGGDVTYCLCFPRVHTCVPLMCIPHYTRSKWNPSSVKFRKVLDRQNKCTLF